MKLEMELKSGDIVLLKVLACVLIIFFAFRFFIFPGFEKHQDLVQARDDKQVKQEEMQNAIDQQPVIEKKIVKQRQILKEDSEGFYELMENQQVDELVTGIALKQNLKPVYLKIEQTTPTMPGVFQASLKNAKVDTETAKEKADKELDSVDGNGDSESKADNSALKYVNTTLVSMTLQGSEQQIRAMLDDIAKNYPGVQVRSFDMSESTYVDDTLQEVSQNTCQCVLAVYSCGQLGK